MLKREWIKILISACIGVVIFALSMVCNKTWENTSTIAILSAVFFSSVYGVGLIYGIKFIFRISSTILKSIIPMLLWRNNSALGEGCVYGCFSFIIKGILVVFLSATILTIGWIAGVISAAKCLRDAENQDTFLST